MSTASKQSVSIALPTELTATSREHYEQSLTHALSDFPMDLHLDCSPTSLVVSGHVELLWQTKMRCESSGAKLTLEKPSVGLLRVLALLDLADHFVTREFAVNTANNKKVSGQSLSSAHYEDQFAATLESVTAATWRFKTHLEAFPLADLLRFELTTVFYEVANNIREHGNVPEGSAIRCLVRWETTEIVLEFSDYGIAYDPCRIDQVTPANQQAARAPRGYGLALIRRLSDGMSYRRTTDGQNILTLHKRWETVR